MSFFRSLLYDRRIHFAVFLGVVCAAAVLTGALLVGDSMRGSLRALTLDRLGSIDTILQSTGFFEPPKIELPNPWTKSTPGILLPAAVEYDGKISDTQILGVDVSQVPVNRDEIIVNRALADRLDVKTGETVSLRLHSVQNIPPESSLGRRNDLIIRSRVTVREIVPNSGLGRFSLKADQQAEPLILVPLDRLQHRLDVDGKVNCVFFLTDGSEIVSTSEQRKELEKRFEPSFADLGITADGNYLKSDRMLFTKPQAEAIQKAFPDAEPGLLYLATSIRALKNGRETPYSTVYACGDLRPRLFEDCLFLNAWTAEDLDVVPGDEIELAWFAPENVSETKTKIFRLAEVLSMDDADPHLVPDVKGFTDEQSIAEWDPPFPFDAKKIRKKDEDYWDRYRAAPKAFVSLETGRELWGSRFGDTTTFRLSKSPGRQSGVPTNLLPSLFGLNFIPVKEQGLSASAGTTPFSVLFLSFSFFIIASALMLVMMLFRLAVETKAKRIGIRLAVGWTPRQVTRLLLAEGLIISVTGSFVGVLLGILYARLMVYGLTTWWVDAVTVPFLTLHVTPWSLVLGFTSSVVLALLTIAWTLRSVRKIPVKTLLGGDFELPQRAGNAAQRSFRVRPEERAGYLWLAVFTFVLLGSVVAWLVLDHSTVGTDELYEAAFFFGFGAVLLVLLIWGFSLLLRFRPGFDSSPEFAFTNIARNPVRSVLCAGLIASTLFLILSMGAFRLDPRMSRSMSGNRWGYSSNQAGSGGFDLIAETRFPVYHDISTVRGREEMGVQPKDETLWYDAFYHRDHEHDTLYPIRVRDGDNAGCLNLYQASTPRILGLPESYTNKALNYFIFSDWKGREKTKPFKPMSFLEEPITIDPDGVRRVPIVLDANTAMYALHLYGGVGSTYELKTNENGEIIRCEVVALLDNSVLQGDILMGEKNLLELFPEVDGYRFFLMRYRFEGADDVTRILYDMLGDYGLTTETTEHRLRRLYAVQNTYLSTFQSLGGIGLLLGLFGLAVIQRRNVLERRKELALLQAIGFKKSRVMLLLLYESFGLLFAGLFIAAGALLLPLLSQLGRLNPVSLAIQLAWLLGGMLLIAVVSNVAAARSVFRIPVARELAEEK